MTQLEGVIQAMVPPCMHHAVPEVVTRIAPRSNAPSCRLVQDPVRWGAVVVGGYGLRIPYRQYDTPLTSTHLSPAARLVWSAWFSRHHSGYVRQIAARDLLASPEPWVVPFVVQLLGEYVWHISVDIDRALERRVLMDPVRRATYRSFVRDNARFMELTHARARTYWYEYGRRRSSWAESPAHVALARLQNLAREPRADDLPTWTTVVG